MCHNFRSISNNPLPNYNLLHFFTKRQIWRKSRSFPWISAPQSGRGQASREWQSKVCNIWKRISFVEAPMDSLFRWTEVTLERLAYPEWQITREEYATWENQLNFCLRFLLKLTLHVIHMTSVTFLILKGEYCNLSKCWERARKQHKTALLPN